MLRCFDLKNGIAGSLFTEFEQVLRLPLKGLDTEEALASTVNTQLCLLLSGVTTARLLLGQQVVPDFVAGHSVGAFAAAVISGVITFEEALLLVNKRAHLMNVAFPQGYGMTALLGYSAARLKPYLESHNRQHPPIYLANINAADQLVIAGMTDSMKILVETLKRNGLQKAKVLRVAVPSHCELLSSVSQELKALLNGMPLQEPVIPYVSNATGRLLRTAAGIAGDLWLNISTTVQWYDATTLVYERGTRMFLEMAPAGVLSKIAGASFPEAEVIGVVESRTEQAALLWNEYFNKNLY
jgi:malonate decarboxylase epsilon subunit